MKPNKSILLVICFVLLSILPLFILGFPVGADFQNHFGFILPFYDELKQGNFFPGWLGDSNFGFGDPRYRFYPPILYYLICLVQFAVKDWYFSTVIIFTIFSIIGALGTYFWAKQSFSDKSALLASLIFAVVPYHLTQFFQASLFAEYAATAILPFGFLFVQKLSTTEYQNKSKLLFDIGGLGAVFALLVTTHLPTTVISSLSLGVFALLLTDRKNNKKSLFFCALGVLLGVWASAWFWFRMVNELSWIQAGAGVSSEYYDYRNNFLLSPFASVNLNLWYGNLLLVLTIGFFVPTSNLWKKLFIKQPLNEEIQSLSHHSQAKKILLAILLITCLSMLMTTELSRPLWAVIPKLKDIQFPFRWLTITSVALCPLLAISLMIWRQKFKQNGLATGMFVVFLMFAAAFIYSYWGLVVEANFVDRNGFNEKLATVRGSRSFTDWLPRNAKELKDLLPLKSNVEAGKREVAIESWESAKRTFSVGEGVETQARLRTYNYPHWQAFIVKDGQRTPTATNSETDGTLLVTVPPEKAHIEVIFVEPSSTKIAIWTALIGWLMIFGFLLQRLRF